MSYLPSSPDLKNITGLLAIYPRLGVLLFKLLEDINVSFSLLGKGTRELIIAYTSDLNQSEPRYKAHKSMFKELGIDESVFGQLKLDSDNANVDEKLKPIPHFVKKLTLIPGQITQADVNPIFETGWDERALLDTVRLCAVVNCMNRFAMGLASTRKRLTANKRVLPSNQQPCVILEI